MRYLPQTRIVTVPVPASLQVGTVGTQAGSRPGPAGCQQKLKFKLVMPILRLGIIGHRQQASPAPSRVRWWQVTEFIEAIRKIQFAMISSWPSGIAARVRVTGTVTRKVP
jgi:hypothetical protein